MKFSCALRIIGNSQNHSSQVSTQPCFMNYGYLSHFSVVILSMYHWRTNVFTWTRQSLTWPRFATWTCAIFPTKCWARLVAHAHSFLSPGTARLWAWFPVFPVTPLPVHYKHKYNLSDWSCTEAIILKANSLFMIRGGDSETFTLS